MPYLLAFLLACSTRSILSMANGHPSSSDKMAATIQGWTPKTTLLLRSRYPSSAASSHHGVEVSSSNDGYSGFDIIDHAFGHTFPPNLMNELQSNGWLENDSSRPGKLKPARTKMDVDMANLLQSFVSNPFLGDNDGEDVPKILEGGTSMRGDESAFISRQERMEDTFPERYPMLCHFISSIENTACKYLGKRKSANSETICTHSFGSSDNASFFEFDTSLTSVQIAKYPGDGQAGYPRHCDRGPKCLKESTIGMKTYSSSERLLTFVYYLTPSEWDSKLDGGALRIFSPMEHTDSDGGGDHHHFDVTPYSDRLVVFRSDLMEHEVMPSLRRDRIAITVWLYGRVVSKQNQNRITTNSKNDGTTFKCNDIPNGNSSLPPPLPIISTKEEMSKDRSIFVAIPSYRDKETWPTIKSLIEMAYNPERVTVGVVFQVDTVSIEEVQSFTTLKGSGVSMNRSQWNQDENFRSITMDYRHATGPCYARHLAQTLHRGEDYILQIDSHMRFRPNWDEFLIQQLNKTECPEKAVLTAYPPGYEPPHGPGSNAETRATVLVPWKFGKEDGMLRQKGRLIRADYQHNSNNDNIPCLLYAGGFNFFHSSILDICPYSKLHGLFFGEEISMAARLYTNGIDLFAPPQTVCYHLWQRNSLRVKDDNDRYKVKQRKEALEIVRAQLQGLGRDLGTVRSIDQFSKDLGVDFDKQSSDAGYENAGLSDDVFVSQIRPEQVLNAGSVGGETESCRNLSEREMSSVLNLVGQFMKESP